MGCNTSKDTALQPPEETKDKNENDSPKVDDNNVDEITETKEEKPPSAKTITIKSNADDLEEAVDLTDPDLAGAATKIQAAFRGHQTRRTMKHEDKATKSTGSQQQQQQQHQQEEFENEFASGDVELTHAATKIQASFRGHMVRKQMDKEDGDGDQKPQKPTPEEEELDIDLTDPELNKAATKIQASFRGHAVRKEQTGEPETK